MTKLFLLLLTLSNVAFGDILLVANKNTSPSDYKKICEKNKYLCLPQSFLKLQQKKSFYFDLLIENFDLDNNNYVSEFSKNLALSLKEDDLNLDQIKNLIMAAEKIEQNNRLNLAVKIKNLKRLQSTLEAIQIEPSDKLLFIAGVAVANNLQNRMQLDPFLNEIKHTEVDYISYSTSVEKKYFLNGDCDHPRYTELISQTELQVIPHFSEGCNLNQKYNWGSVLMVDHFEQNKNKYLVVLAAVATMFFLKSYEVSMGE